MDETPIIALIVAVSRNHVIGREGELPWHLPSDLQFFKSVTLGKPVIMGRVTWESLPLPLPGRDNLVLTRNPDYVSPRAEIYHDFDIILQRAKTLAQDKGAGEIIIAGGANIYSQAMAYCQKMYITRVDTDIQGDAHFPDIDPQIWQSVSQQDFPRSEQDAYAFSVNIYQRR